MHVTCTCVCALCNGTQDAQSKTVTAPLQGILQYVNQQLYLAQSRQRLVEHQSKLDTSALERTSHPIAQQFKVTRCVCVCVHACVCVCMCVRVPACLRRTVHVYGTVCVPAANAGLHFCVL